MPKVGDKEFPYTNEGYKEAAQESSETGIPISDGAARNVTEYAGGGKTGYSQIGQEYKEGGQVVSDRKYKRLKKGIERAKRQDARNSLRSKMAGSRAFRDEIIEEAKADKKEAIKEAKETEKSPRKTIKEAKKTARKRIRSARKTNRKNRRSTIMTKVTGKNEWYRKHLRKKKKGGKVNTSPKGKKIPKGNIASSLRQRANIKKSERIKGKKPAPPFSTRFGSSILDEDKK